MKIFKQYQFFFLSTVQIMDSITTSSSGSQHKTACFWEHAARSMNACVSIYMLVLLSIDRYVAIVLSIKRNRVYEWARNVRKSVGKLNFLCIMIWFIAILITLPGRISVKRF